MNHPNPHLTTSWLQPCRHDRRIRRDLGALMRNISGTDLTEVSTRFDRFTKPVTPVWGMRDRCFTPGLAKRLAARFPNVKVVEVPDAKTFVPLDAPTTLVNAITMVAADIA